MYVSINKHLIHFQNCFGGLSWLCQVKGEYMLSNFKCLCRQHFDCDYGLGGPFSTVPELWDKALLYSWFHAL